MKSAALSQDIVGMIQSIVRYEVNKLRLAEVGVVTQIFAHESGSDKNNYACNVKLRDSGLELQKVAVATQRVGQVAIPNVDDLVLVQFIGGNLHGAVITGRLYNDIDRPPEAKGQEFVYVCPDEAEPGIRRVYLELPNNNKILIDDDKVKLEIGDTKLTINNSGDVEIKSKAKVTVESQSNTQIKSRGDIKIEAGGKVELKAGSDVKIEGLSVDIKAKTTARIEGRSLAGVKGAMVNIAGMTSFSAS